MSAPPLPEAIIDGTIRLLKKVGDRVSIDETVAEIETDQINLEVYTPESGTIESILVADGDTVTYETEIARITLNGRNSGATISSTSSTGVVHKVRFQLIFSHLFLFFRSE